MIGQGEENGNDRIGQDEENGNDKVRRMEMI